ncbi:sugar phosphate nucleotidyltransferase [Actinomarinicola tropica]|uniref:NTP transferase domain-containing protein n=1 Tax=Actinomarinicola tropica TaxID=2789776 RepID=A0A5Q2RN48_9ACTN|nr:sugar phosphate nucleotidyltransferase [Actinomarinicola tropica]QGG95517.1 NTP transferase domain-containing protein [Actinomarinicola tropica]
MADSLAALVLAAGAGTRLAPLTRLRPKALCPVDGRPLVDLALERVAPLVAPGRVAVNVHHGRAQMEEHLAGRAHLSIEEHEALGTAGGVAAVAEWLGDDGLVVVNADTWCRGDDASILEGWDGERVRVVVEGAPELGPRSRIVASVMPAAAVRRLRPEPSGLYEVCWRDAAAAGRLDVVGWSGRLVDCATPRDYLVANLVASDGRSVVGEGASVDGDLDRSVVWPGATVRAGEALVGAIRASAEMTVLVRPLPAAG